MSAQSLISQEKTSQKQWSNSIANTAAWSRSGAVAKFRLLIGYDCLENHTFVSHRIRLFHNLSTRRDEQAPFVEMYLYSTFESQRYWEARGRMST
jgi:hypothetical protein